jgi:hypothetical protein
MKNLIEELYNKHHLELELSTDKLNRIRERLKATYKTESTSRQDCRMLQLLCLEHKPKKILEVGTWIGMTSYAMAFSTPEDTKITTCDNRSAFVEIGEISKKIHTNPFTLSTNVIKKNYQDLKDLSLFWNDANVSTQDCELIYSLFSNKFVFATHDYYDQNGNFQKGYNAFCNIKNICESNNAKIKTYIPEKNWYKTGYIHGINGCVAIITGEKPVQI